MAQHTFGHDDFGRHLVDADDPHAALFEQAGNAREQPVVAAAEEPDDPRQQPDRLPVEADLRQRRPQHRADEQRLAAALGAGEDARNAPPARRNPMMGIALDHLGIGPARAPRTSPADGRAATIASATAPGKLPPPQMIATGSPPAVTTVALGASGCIVVIVGDRPARRADASKAVSRRRG